MDDQRQELLDTIENAREELANLEELVLNGATPKIERVAEIVLVTWKAIDNAQGID